jgi:hypothetical protein
MPHGFEIERKYLLDAMPQVPQGAERWRIEQGYLSPQSPAPRERGDDVRREDATLDYGRLRRTIMPDGSVVCTHTVRLAAALNASSTNARSPAKSLIDTGRARLAGVCSRRAGACSTAR